MEVFLGAASFVHILKTLGKEFSEVRESTIAIWLPSKTPFFSISRENWDPKDCGYVETNWEYLSEIFSKDEVETIISTCWRECSQSREISHCSIFTSPDRYAEIVTKVNGRTYFCHMARSRLLRHC
jgi:hypothetical protein